MAHPTKFVITGQGRCGSNLLKFALMKHPSIVMIGEFYNKRVFPESPTTDGYKRAKAFFEREYEGKTCAGFKIFAHHAVQGEAVTGWDYLQENDVRIIHLVRENRVERLISLEAASISQAWTDVPELKELHDSIRINHSPKWWENAIKKDIAVDDKLAERFKDSKYLRVNYEELAANWEENIGRVENFLGVEETPLPMTLKKQESTPKEVRCENFDELWKHFRRSEHRWMWEPTGTQRPNPNVSFLERTKRAVRQVLGR